MDEVLKPDFFTELRLFKQGIEVPQKKRAHRANF